MTASDSIVDLVRGVRFAYRDEDQLQAGIAEALTAAGFSPQREVRLSGTDRIDLLVGSIGVEVKVAGAVGRLAAQLARYAASARVDELVVVTTRRQHRALPAEVGGKPVTVVHLMGAR